MQRAPEVTASNVSPSASLPVFIKAGWGIGSIGTQIVLFAPSLLLLYFFTVVLGIQPAVAGTLLFVAKVYDAILAPFVGTWTDRAQTRWGRRRPFMFVGGLFCAGGLFFIFNTPTAQLPVLLGGLLLISTGYSLFNIPYLAMPTEMTDSPIERTSIMSWRIACVGIGTALATSLLPVVAKAYGADRYGYGVAGAVAAGLVLIAMLVAVAMTGKARATRATGERFSLIAMVKAVGDNQPFRLLLAAKIFQLLGLAATSAAILFFFKDVIGGGESMLALWGLVANVVSILSMLIWPALGKRFGKIPVYCLCVAAYSLIGFTWLLAGPDSTMMSVMARGLGAGIVTGGLLLMGQSILADAIGADFTLSGLRREGLFSAAYSFVEKASSALGPMVVGLVLQVMGFDPHAGTSSEHLDAIYVAVGVIPPVVYLISIWPLLLIKLPPPQAAPDLPDAAEASDAV